MTTALGAALSLGAAWPAASAVAAGCPNEDVRSEQVYASTLPDCRAYEQVSPVEKNLSDARGGTWAVVSSPTGEFVTFDSNFAFPGALSSKAGGNWYLSARGPDGWTTADPSPPVSGPPLTGFGVREGDGVTDDAGDYVVEVEEEPVSKPGLVSFYLRDSATEQYRLLAVSGPGGEYEGVYEEGAPFVVYASRDDSRILFEDRSILNEDGTVKEPGTPGEPNLYEWLEGRVVLIAKDATAGGGSVAGEIYAQNTIAEDGSRVFYTVVGGHRYTEQDTGQIYMREGSGAPVKVSAGAAQWRAATSDGTSAFYTEAGGLYRWTLPPGGEPSTTTIASTMAKVLGLLGVSEDGSYAYFVAEEVLADNENGNKEHARENEANLYEWHAGGPEPVFIARLKYYGDGYDWEARNNADGSAGAGPGEKSSRVSSAGTTLLFASERKLTSYGSNGTYELYRFEAPSSSASVGTLVCVSCNPSENPATSQPFLAGFPVAGVQAGIRLTHLTRNLSADGNRVFFDSSEVLLPQDTNGEMNVYEWEREGTPYGSCVVGAGNGSGGCLYLISTGTSGAYSYFGDASADGRDVFFFTRQSLVRQDRDFTVDLYDAREYGGIQAQNAPPAVPCVGEVCHGVPAAAPLFGAPSSATFSGSGNVAPAPAPKVEPKPAKCRRGFVRRHGRCVRTVRRRPTGRRAKGGSVR